MDNNAATSEAVALPPSLPRNIRASPAKPDTPGTPPTDVGEHLAFLGNMGDEGGAVHDLAYGIALRERTQGELQVEWPRGIAIGREDRSVEEQAIFRGHLASLEWKQSRGYINRFYLEL